MKSTEIKTELDRLEFGEYVINENDCDVMAVKARTWLAENYPELETGICIMYGFALAKRLLGHSGQIGFSFAGHGILVIKCDDGEYYYDCTTQDGKDGSRINTLGWWGMWWTYLTYGFIVFVKYNEWGNYTPAILRGKRGLEGLVRI